MFVPVRPQSTLKNMLTEMEMSLGFSDRDKYEEEGESKMIDILERKDPIRVPWEMHGEGSGVQLHLPPLQRRGEAEQLPWRKCKNQLGQEPGASEDDENVRHQKPNGGAHLQYAPRFGEQLLCQGRREVQREHAEIDQRRPDYL